MGDGNIGSAIVREEAGAIGGMGKGSTVTVEIDVLG